MADSRAAMYQHYEGVLPYALQGLQRAYVSAHGNITQARVSKVGQCGSKTQPNPLGIVNCAGDDSE